MNISLSSSSPSEDLLSIISIPSQTGSSTSFPAKCEMGISIFLVSFFCRSFAFLIRWIFSRTRIAPKHIIKGISIIGSFRTFEPRPQNSNYGLHAFKSRIDQICLRISSCFNFAYMPFPFDANCFFKIDQGFPIGFELCDRQQHRSLGFILMDTSFAIEETSGPSQLFSIVDYHGRNYIT